MSIRIRALSHPLSAALLILLLLNPVVSASADSAALATAILTPATMVSTQGSTVGAVASLRVQDQSGTIDTPAKYVLFQTPGVVYKGYRTFNIPASVSPGMVSGMVVKVNYKGPLKTAQAWTWYLYDWVHLTWVKIGDNTAVTSNTTWKVLQFTAAGDIRRFVNNSTRQIRLQVLSGNALYDTKLDYEGITISYGACTDPLGCVLVQSGQSVHIAYLLNMPSLEAKNGASVALDKSVTILGHWIQFDGMQQPNCDPAAAVTAAQKMVTDSSILAVMGTTCSGEAFQVMPVFSPAGFSMISPTNTNPGLTDPGTPGYLRVSWNDKQQGELAAAYAKHLGLTKAATIGDGVANSYSTTLIQAFVDAFTTGGGTITAQKTVTSGQTDMRSMLNDIKAGSPEMIYMPIFMPEGGFVINQAGVILGPPGTVHLMGSDSLYDKNVVLATGSDLQGFTVTGIDSKQFSAGYAAFVTAYATKFGVAPSPSAFAPYGYDAFNVIRAAIQKSAVILGSGAHLIGRKALRDALYATSGFAGLTGTITCKPDGDCAATPALGVFEYTPGVDDPVSIWP